MVLHQLGKRFYRAKQNQQNAIFSG